MIDLIKIMLPDKWIVTHKMKVFTLKNGRFIVFWPEYRFHNMFLLSLP